MKKREELYAIVPISLELDWPDKEDIIDNIMKRYKDYGLRSFMLAFPCGGWRSIGYPPKEVFREKARIFAEIKKELSDYDIDLGWWRTLTLKCGDGFSKSVGANGREHPFAACGLDPDFIERFSDDTADFAAIAKPDFIMTEDDFSVSAAGGCYCKRHLDEFSKRIGKYFSREELLTISNEKKDGAKDIVKAWQELKKDTLIAIAKEVRRKVDILSPEIPIGIMQQGGDKTDGNCTEELARAFAGENHTPFARIHGTFYTDCNPKAICQRTFFALHSRQNIKGDFLFLHESDTFPHIRYFVPASYMRMLMSMMYSYGFEGSVFQTDQLLDDPAEEPVYAAMHQKERKRFNAISRAASECRVRGVEISFDPFNSTYHIPNGCEWPKWTYSVSRFGIPFTTTEEPVAFWDDVSALYSEDEAVKKCLSKVLFLDADAAKALCERGYGKYIGVEIGEDVAERGKLRYDLAAREVIREEFAAPGRGRHMTSAHMLARKNGKMLEMKITDPSCVIISELFSFTKEPITPAMTLFENELGGKVIVLATTVKDNDSQALLNYRRQRLFHSLISRFADEYAFVTDAPDIFLLQNEAVSPIKSGFSGILTLINVCEDDLEKAHLHLPKKFIGKEYFFLDIDGEWKPMKYEKVGDGIILTESLNNLEPYYIMIK